MTKKTHPVPGSIYKELSGPDAEALAELYVLEDCLNASRRCLELYFDKITGKTRMLGDDAVISQALFRDGIILFCSCFSKRRDSIKPSPEEVYDHLLKEGWQDKYQQLLDVRDSFAAHNHGALRQKNVGIECRDDGDGLRVVDIVGHGMNGAFSADSREMMLSWVTIAARHNGQRIAAMLETIMSRVRKLSATELAALPDLGFKQMDRTDWRKTRERFRETTKQRPTLVPPSLSGRIIKPE